MCDECITYIWAMPMQFSNEILKGPSMDLIVSMNTSSICHYYYLLKTNNTFIIYSSFSSYQFIWWSFKKLIEK